MKYNKIMWILAMVMVVLATIASGLPTPHTIRGYVVDSTGTTQVPSGTPILLNDTTSGYYIEGKTGRGPSSPGKYSIVVDGEDGDTVFIKAWNLTYQGNITVALESSMYNVNIMLNDSRPNTPPEITSNPILTVYEDTLYSYDVEAFDHLDTLSYWLSENPVGMNISSTIGLIQWLPDNDFVGQNNVNVFVQDSFNSTTNQSYTIEVIGVNDPPEIISSPNLTAIEDIQYLYNVGAIDIDNNNSVSTDDNNLTYLLTTYPIGMNIDNTTGVLNWTPGNNDVGSNEIIVEVSDGSLSDTQSFIIRVQNVNDPPVVTSVALTAAIANTLYEYDVAATDPDDDSIIFSLNIGPSGMSINNLSGIIQWVPTIGQEGLHNISVNISDGTITINHNFTVNVTVTNYAPNITSIPVREILEDTNYTYDVNATDPDLDVLNYSLVTYPIGMMINSTNGLITWVPSNDHVGENSVIVEVSDGNLSDVQSFSIYVNNTNDVPEFTSSPVTIVAEDAIYSYDVNAIDVDSDNITYILNQSPSGATINPNNGLITWSPVNDDVGNHTFIVIISDATNQTNEYSNQTNQTNVTQTNQTVINQTFNNQTFVVNVSPVNDGPVITSAPIAIGFTYSLYSYQVIVIDPDNQNSVDYDDDTIVYNLTTYPEGMTINSSTGLIEWTPDEIQIGHNNIVVSVSDGLISATQTFSIDVSYYVPPTTSSTTSSSSGGGISIIPAESQPLVYEEEIIDAVPQTPKSITVPVENIAITELILYVRRYIEDSTIKIEVISDVPNDVLKASENYEYIYSYFDIQKEIITNEDLETTTIRFKVDKEWMNNVNTDGKNIVLKRYTGYMWTELDTILVNEDDKYYYYESESPGFSYFAITLKEIETERPSIIGHEEMYSKSLSVPYHIYGTLLTHNNRTQVPRGTSYSFTNLNSSQTIKGESGGGPYPGYYSILVGGYRGDVIELIIDDYRVEFTLTSDKQINFVTNIRPEIDWYKVTKFVTICILIFIAFYIYFSGNKRKKLKQRSKKTPKGKLKTGLSLKLKLKEFFMRSRKKKIHNTKQTKPVRDKKITLQRKKSVTKSTKPTKSVKPTKRKKLSKSRKKPIKKKAEKSYDLTKVKPVTKFLIVEPKKEHALLFKKSDKKFTKMKPINIPKIISNVIPVIKHHELTSDEYFYMVDGSIYKTLTELMEGLLIISDEQFNHHVNSEKNDFANWIEKVFENSALGVQIRTAHSKEELLDILCKYLNSFSYK